MNKKILIAVAVLLLLGGGYYFMNKSKGPEGSSNTQMDAKVTGETSGSLKDLLSKGVAQTCTYSTEEGSGKVYVSGGSMRGDFETKTEGTVTKGHMIVKDNTSYVWTDDTNTGFKMEFDPNSVDASAYSDTSVQNQATDLNANYDYKCSSWVVDSSQFNPPTTVTFTSFEIPNTVPGAAPGTGSGTSGSSQQCGYCNVLTGDDKAQCLTAFKCN